MAFGYGKKPGRIMMVVVMSIHELTASGTIFSLRTDGQA